MGQGQPLPDRLSHDRELHFPLLPAAGYEVTSPATENYNCVAYASGDETHWWQPSREFGYFWPDYASQGYTLDCLISVFQGQQYERCENNALELGYEKVAIYGFEDDEWSHVAKQLPDGSWTSKLGKWEDINHPTVYALTSDLLGQAKCYMRRRKE